MSNAATLLIGRIFLSAIFILSGLSKLGDPAGTAGYMTSLGLPLASIGVWIVILLEVLGGIAVLVGFMTKPAAWALALFCIASALLAHSNIGDQAQFIAFFKNLAIAGGFMALAVHGPGSISVDARRAG